MVRYYNDSTTYRLRQKRRVAAWLGEVAREEGYTLGDVTYIFCSSAVHRKMNIDFIGHDYFTDIITFDYSDLKHERLVSGDIFIDVETVADTPAYMAPRHARRCCAWWYTACCICAVRRIRHPAPNVRCTARRISILSCGTRCRTKIKDANNCDSTK